MIERMLLVQCAALGGTLGNQRVCVLLGTGCWVQGGQRRQEAGSQTREGLKIGGWGKPTGSTRDTAACWPFFPVIADGLEISTGKKLLIAKGVKMGRALRGQQP